MADPKKPAPAPAPKKAPPLKEAPATQKISKEELAELIKKAEEEDPDGANAKPPKKK